MNEPDAKRFCPTCGASDHDWERDPYNAQPQAVAWLIVFPNGGMHPTRLKADMEHFKNEGMKIIDLFDQPSQDALDAERFRVLVKAYNNHCEVKFHKKHFAVANRFTNYPYEIYPTLEQAADAYIESEKQNDQN